MRYLLLRNQIPALSCRNLSSSTSIPIKKQLTQFDVCNDDTLTLKPRSHYALHTLDELMQTTQMPQCSTCTSRDFIHNALYNPNYGYFSKQANIFNLINPIDCTKLHSTLEFMNLVAKEYSQIEAQLEHDSFVVDDVTRQIWHTPTELFKPWYGEAIAAYILKKHMNVYGPQCPLTIIEIGGGNGTLMLNILNHIKQTVPEVYANTQYKIYEISRNLATIQTQSAIQHGHQSHVTVDLQSIFDITQNPTTTTTTTTRPCFLIALEVVDNLAHDVVRFDHSTNMPLTGLVTTNELNDMREEYVPVTDTLLNRALALHSVFNTATPLTSDFVYQLLRFCPRPVRSVLVNQFPFFPNVSNQLFIPSNMIRLLETVKTQFPTHHMIVSDFAWLPDTISSDVNAPVVQTRYKNAMIPVSTYLVQPGFFDIFFPTNFDFLANVYSLMMHPAYDPNCVPNITVLRKINAVDRLKLVLDVPDPHLVVDQGRPWICSHRQFLTQYADLTATTTISGENPMLMYYENCKFLLS